MTPTTPIERAALAGYLLVSAAAALVLVWRAVAA